MRQHTNIKSANREIKELRHLHDLQAARIRYLLKTSADVEQAKDLWLEKAGTAEQEVTRISAARRDLLRQLHDKDDELAHTNRLLVKANAEVILWANLAALRGDTLAQMEVQLSQWQGHAHAQA